MTQFKKSVKGFLITTQSLICNLIALNLYYTCNVINTIMNIIIIDNYDSFTYNLVHYIEGMDHNVTVMLNDEIQEEKISKADALVLAPGPGLPSESGALMQMIHRYYDKKPMLGICLGMQALAQYSEMEIYNMNEVCHGIAVKVKQFGDNLLFRKVEKEFEVGLYHSWAVQEVSLPWVLTAATNHGTVMAMEHASLLHAALQFHPESIMTPSGNTMLQNWLVNVEKSLQSTFSLSP